MIIGDDAPQIVRAGDLDFLDHIWRAVEDRAFELSMENLQEVMAAAGNLALDAAEFIPGAGQAFAVGRIIASVAMFLGSADFADIKEALSAEALEQVTNLAAHLKDGLQVDDLWMFLLFDADTSFVDKLSAHDSKSPRHARLSRKRGRIGKLLSLLRQLGTTFAIQFENMRDRIQPPLRTTQSFVLTHPVLAFGVTAAAQLLEFGVNVNPATVADDVADAFEERVSSFVDAIEGFELPDELVPLDLAIDVIIGLILDRLGGKGKLANEILYHTGARQEIARMIADELKLADLNPNKIWMESIRTDVDVLLNAARSEVLGGMFAALHAVGLDNVTEPGEKEVGAKAVPHPAAAEPALAPGVDLADVLPEISRQGDAMPSGSGAALPIGHHVAAARRHGSSFDHVRLHRTPLAAGLDGLSRGQSRRRAARTLPRPRARPRGVAPRIDPCRRTRPVSPRPGAEWSGDQVRSRRRSPRRPQRQPP